VEVAEHPIRGATCAASWDGHGARGYPTNAR
jgi:hypothetical protein